MLSRLRLSSKMVLVAAPLVAVLIGLLTLTVGTNIQQIAEADRTGSLGATWEPLVVTLEAVDAEQDMLFQGDANALGVARLETDTAFGELNQAVSRVPDAGALQVTVADAMSSLGRARATADSGDASGAAGIFLEYSTTQETLVNLGDLLAAEATDTELGRKLQAVAALTRAAYNTDQLLELIDLTITSGRTINVDRADLLRRNAVFALERFEASAPSEWREIYERRNLPATTDASIAELEWLLERGPEITSDDAARFDMQRFSAPIVSETGLRNLLAEQVTDDAASEASSIARQTIIRIGYVTLAILVALVLSFLTSRSITRRIGRVSERAREVADEQLPTLVESLRDPSGSTPLPTVTPIDGVGSDEIGDLAESFTAVQATLVEVAAEQMDVLRRGVSDIFVTLARRNRSLVDRQLALLDELEANVDDPELLSDYYKLDHIATRMRRSAESLLVLANTDTQRRRSGPVEIDDVVRAAMSEVEDYRRIDVLALEGLQIQGPLVAATSHLRAELLDNAASFSPPDSRVAVAGHFTGAGYLITISDRGVGIPADRLKQVNALLAKPPVIGLSVEPTLGLSVVSLLAAKHNIKVSLVQAAPGVSVNVVIPSSMYQHTTDNSAGPGFDEAFEEAFNDVVPDGADAAQLTEVAPGETQVAAAAAAEATSSALDAIAAVNRDAATPPEPARPADSTPIEPTPEPAPGDGPTGLPHRRPAPTADATPATPQPAPAAGPTPAPPHAAPHAAPAAGPSGLPQRRPAPTAGPTSEPAPQPAPTAGPTPEPAPRPAPAAGPTPATPQPTPQPAATTDRSGLPQRRPTSVDARPEPKVADFRPVPVPEAPPVAPVEPPPAMPAPVVGDLPRPDLAPPAVPPQSPNQPLVEPSSEADLPTRSPAPAPTPAPAAPRTAAGLPRRDGTSAIPEPEARPVVESTHDPEALRSTLSAFHTSTQLGRLDGADHDHEGDA